MVKTYTQVVPRPRLHDDALRNRLLEVASVVISTDGPAGLTVRGVAGRAGTSASAVYALFGSREALLTAVREEAWRRFAEHLASAERSGDPGADLLFLGLAYRRSALEDPAFYRVMFDDIRFTDEPGPVTTRATFVLLRDAVARVLAPADGRADDAAVEPALCLWAVVHGLVSLELDDLLPGSPGTRTARYTAALGAVGPALLAMPAGAGPGR